MSSLPQDIIVYDILTRLPLESLSRFRCVCRTWSNLFTTPHFSKLQLDHSLKHGRYSGILIVDELEDTNICYSDYDPVSSTLSPQVAKIDHPVGYERRYILGVCDGLICYATKKNDIIIWNPYTNIYKKLPNPPESAAGLDIKDTVIRYEFGYDARTEDYKFAIMVIGSRDNELRVYSCRTNKWKTMVNLPFFFTYSDKILFNGILHWIKIPGSGLQRTIGCLDLESFTFKEIQLPPELLDRNKFFLLDFWVLEGCLYLNGCIRTYEGFEAWTMKEYGVRESWTKMFSSYDKKKFGGATGYVTFRDSLGNGVILTTIDLLYDLNKEEAKELTINGFPIRCEPHTWVFSRSLASPTFGTSHNRMDA